MTSSGWGQPGDVSRMTAVAVRLATAAVAVSALLAGAAVAWEPVACPAPQLDVRALEAAAARLLGEKRHAESAACAKLAINLRFHLMLGTTVGGLAREARRLDAVPSVGDIFDPKLYGGKGGGSLLGHVGGLVGGGGGGDGDDGDSGEAQFRAEKAAHEASVRAAVQAAAAARARQPTVVTPKSWPFHRGAAPRRLGRPADGASGEGSVATSDSGSDDDGDDEVPPPKLYARGFFPDDAAQRQSAADYEAQIRRSREALASVLHEPVPGA